MTNHGVASRARRRITFIYFLCAVYCVNSGCLGYRHVTQWVLNYVLKFNGNFVREFFSETFTWFITSYYQISTTSVVLLTHWPVENLDAFLKIQFSFLFYWLLSSDLLIMPSHECHGTLLMISQHWFRWWHGAVRQQVITWANVDPDLCCHMASIGHELLRKLILPGWAMRVFALSVRLWI